MKPSSLRCPQVVTTPPTLMQAPLAPAAAGDVDSCAAPPPIATPAWWITIPPRAAPCRVA